MFNNRVFHGPSMKKVLLDSVIVGKLNHDLRVKKFKTLGAGECMKGLTKIFELKK